MDKIKYQFYCIEWQDPISELDYTIESDEALNKCTAITEDVAIRFGEWLDSLTEEDMGTESIKDLFTFFKNEVY